MMVYSDPLHMCECCMERFPCPVDKHDCRIEWETFHTNHYLALSCQYDNL